MIQIIIGPIYRRLRHFCESPQRWMYFLKALWISDFAGQLYFLYRSRWLPLHTTFLVFGARIRRITGCPPVLINPTSTFWPTISFRKRVAASRSWIPPSQLRLNSTIHFSDGMLSIVELSLFEPPIPKKFILFWWNR